MKVESPDDVLTRIRMEFVEMPDLKLTLQQAGRFLNLSDDRCGRAFTALVERGFLVRTSSGAFLRCG